MIIDIHGHILDVAYRSKKPLNFSLGGLTDVPLMRVGGVTGQLCAIWTPNIMLSGPHSHSVEAPLRTTLEVLDYVHRELSGPAGEDVLLVRSLVDLQTAESKGCVALIIGMEGTDALGGDPRVLQNLHSLGLRHVGLVHEHANEFGAATQVWERGKMRVYEEGKDSKGYLSDRGRKLLEEMCRLGILIDLTHLVEPGFWEVLEFVKRPVLVSHGGARSLTNSVRYLSDKQIVAIAHNGGLIGASPTPLVPSNEQPGLPLLLDTIDYLVKLVGADHVGIGTDFKDQLDYYPPPFTKSSETPAVVQGLRNRGYNTASIDQIIGGNFLRLFEQVVG